MEACNRILTIHRVSDPNQTNLLDQHWEIFYPILSCTNQQLLPTFILSQPVEITKNLKIWQSNLPLCIVLQVFHFLELIVWCVEHYSNLTRSVITDKKS